VTDIWTNQVVVVAEAISEVVADGKNIAAIGNTNQRETTVIWDSETGKPIHRAIVWQDRRTADYCDQLKEGGYTDMIQKKTGLLVDAYFSGTKIKWLLDNVEGARQKAEEGKLAFETVDSWIIWNFTKGDRDISDVINA